MELTKERIAWYKDNHVWPEIKSWVAIDMYDPESQFANAATKVRVMREGVWYLLSSRTTIHCSDDTRYKLVAEAISDVTKFSLLASVIPDSNANYHFELDRCQVDEKDRLAQIYKDK